MAIKTKKNNSSVKAYVDAIEEDQQRKDARKLLKIFKEVTGERPKMWGTSIIGYGSYHYKYNSGHEGDWPRTGFSPRKGNFSIYIMPGFKEFKAELKKLGKHKLGKSCLYVKKLEDVDEKILAKIIKASLKTMKRIYPS